MATQAWIVWKCPDCGHEHRDDQDDEQGPFCTVTCSGCGIPFDQDDVPGLTVEPA